MQDGENNLIEDAQPTALKEVKESHDTSVDNTTQDNDSVQNTSGESVPIVEVELVNATTDDKEPGEKENVDEKEKTKQVKKVKSKEEPLKKTSPRATNTKSLKKIDNKIVAKIDNKTASKVSPRKTNSADNKLNSNKTAPKVTSRLGEYIKKPSMKSLKEDPSDMDINKKLSKNVVNTRKASMPDVKRNSVTVMPVVSVTAKDRRSSMPASRVDLNTSSRSVGSKSVISEDGEDDGKKVVKRNPPKSKWDNIMSNINNGKEAAKNKPKAEVKNRLNANKGPTTKSNITTKPPTPRSNPSKPEPKKLSASPKPRTGMFQNGLKKHKAGYLKWWMEQ